MVVLDQRLVDKLRCPLTHQSFRILNVEDLIHWGLASDQTEGWTGALLRADELAIYPVRRGIPVLLGEEIYPVIRRQLSPSDHAPQR